MPSDSPHRRPRLGRRRAAHRAGRGQRVAGATGTRL